MSRKQNRQDNAAGLLLSVAASLLLGGLGMASHAWLLQSWPLALLASAPPLPFALLFALRLNKLRGATS